jgi:polar amino acid transport system substrate-binding protein
VTHPEPIAVSHYVGVLAPENVELRDRIDRILKQAMHDGRLETIFRKWKVWNEDQPQLFARVLKGDPIAPVTGYEGYEAESIANLSRLEATRRYLPAFLRAATITLIMSCGAMLAAVMLGIAIATGRLYGDRFTRLALTGYVELIRGTPLLLQLFVLYYGIAAAIRLPAFVAALLGLALNYAAYESEIYRGALLSVPVGQLEASRALGFSEFQTLRLIRGPQAFRLALAPMTNDFVALLKDSSLVSVLTVVELTKQTQIFATNLGSWVIPGAMCAVLYLAMSLPLAALARMLERRWRIPTS